MLFNSIPFLFAFLPITFVGFFVLGSKSHRFAALWLAVASLFFYGWWNVNFVGLLMASVLGNYVAGWLIGHETRKSGRNYGKLFLGIAITGDLLLLGYFKYANFFASSISVLLETPPSFGEIVLPLGVSFFTFTQIAFLADTYQGTAKEYNFIHYLLFVTYFPHLIAGPILHHKQMMPQFAKPLTYRLDWSNISVGTTILAIGLVKKVLIADTFGQIATPVFSLAQHGGHPTLTTAWAGALAYTLQLYFDFSGYSDMAIGISRLFNVKLPLNFNSPYKATNIIDFWRRWHMTLSAFLLKYVYIPLGGNRHGKARRYLNLLLTMLLGGLWHGAGWTFVLWGGLHGIYLIVNHGFRSVVGRFGWSVERFGVVGTIATGLLTFVAVTVGWVFFRAENFDTAQLMLWGMVGGHGISRQPVFGEAGFNNKEILLLISSGLLIVWFLPNSQQFPALL
jgi:alginate O-acetyltransferase complex protein AlgI